MKLTQIQHPGPSGAFVFHDESLLTLPDGMWSQLLCGPVQWGDGVGARHSSGATFSFAEGHLEHWKWLGINSDLPGNAALKSIRDFTRVTNAMTTGNK
ncbi:MAG: hypothetical protein NT154_19470 [Verrucomicrobia bacterium]|nr:hypothetical protein [Verrucomicrobiota bacterium]